jgi:hypothetical protein
MSKNWSDITRREFCARASAALAAGTLGVGTGFFAAPSAALAGTPDLGIGANLNGAVPFPADNPWNLDISNAPLDTNSDNLIASIGLTTGLHPDFGSSWGFPYVVVPGNQPKVPVTFSFAGESDPGPYPIPPNAPIEDGPNSTGDRHVLVIDRDNWILYELFYAFPQPDGSWQAASGAIFNLNSDALRPAGWTSADAAGLPIFPGLVRYEEAVINGVITHAFRFTAKTTRADFVYPARHYASSNTSLNVPAMGTRVRLKASFDISSFPPVAQVILKALKKYGMMLADNGSNWFISGAIDSRWDDAALNTLKSVQGSNFEVVIVSPPSTGGGVALQNGSFEAPAMASAGITAYTTTAPVGWTMAGASGGVWRPVVGPEVARVPDGNQVAWLNSGAWLFQDLGTPVDPNRTYQLTLSAGAEIDIGYASNGYYVALVAGGVAGTVIGSASGTVQRTSEFVQVTISGPGRGSGSVGVLIRATSGQPLFDNVQFQASSAPSGNAVAAKNPSFESPAMANAGLTAYTTAAPDGWTLAGASGGVWRPVVGPEVAAVPDGNQVAWLNSGAWLFQDLGTAVDPSKTYQLTLSVGSEIDIGYASNGYYVALVAGGITGAVIGSSNGTLQRTSGFVQLTISGKGQGTGNLGIVLRATAGQPLFDNVVVQVS